MILFTCSCMSNAVGLNISSAFNSAITIYILIPVILIPQLIFSGVVFPFEKLNPDISSQDKVPVYGEIMASRWAYEAAMVEQFKANIDILKPIGDLAVYDANKYQYPFKTERFPIPAKTTEYAVVAKDGTIITYWQTNNDGKK